jgi:hypothetical protein
VALKVRSTLPKRRWHIDPRLLALAEQLRSHKEEGRRGS